MVFEETRHVHTTRHQHYCVRETQECVDQAGYLEQQVGRAAWHVMEARRTV